MLNKKGFTLIELLIAMAISTIVLAAIFSFYRVQTKSHRNQQLVVQMQQNMRAAMFLLEREIRMAGYSTADPAAPAGFIENFDGLGSPHDGSGAATDANNIAFTVDDNNSGAIEDATSMEIIAYRLNGADNTLERWGLEALSGSWDWQVVAQQITALAFTFRRADESQIPFPLTNEDMTQIRSLEVAITATSEDRTMNLTHKIKCRNMGF